MLRAPFRRGLWVSQLRALLRSGAAVSALSGCSDGDNDSGAEQAAVTSSGGTSADGDSDGGRFGCGGGLKSDAGGRNLEDSGGLGEGIGRRGRNPREQREQHDQKTNHPSMIP